MSDAKHTPGPWAVEDQRDVYSGSILVAEAFDTSEGLEGSDGEADANAQLIAAAPDLLAACEAGLRLGEIAVRQGLHFDKATVDEIVTKHVDLVRIRAAIAKAKGVQ